MSIFSFPNWQCVPGLGVGNNHCFSCLCPGLLVSKYTFLGQLIPSFCYTGHYRVKPSHTRKQHRGSSRGGGAACSPQEEDKIGFLKLCLRVDSSNKHWVSPSVKWSTAITNGSRYTGRKYHKYTISQSVRQKSGWAQLVSLIWASWSQNQGAGTHNWRLWEEFALRIIHVFGRILFRVVELTEVNRELPAAP